MAVVRLVVVLCSLFVAHMAWAQPADDEVQLNDGFYLTFNDLKHNDPVPIAAVITKLDVRSGEFMIDVMNEAEFSFFDSTGETVTLPSTQLWGFCLNGQVHIQTEFDIARIPVLGRISHFTANVVVYYPASMPSYNPAWGTSMGSSMGSSGGRSNELQQFILDMNTGQVLAYNDENVALLLKPDPTLYNEFIALSGRKRRDSEFLFIRRFNAAHPLVFGGISVAK